MQDVLIALTTGEQALSRPGKFSGRSRAVLGAHKENLMAYVDGFVVPVAKANLSRYREWAQLAAKVWREYGALDYKEWVAEDVKPGKVTSFPQAVQLKDDEVVVFAWATYESRQARDSVMEKVTKDPRMQSDPKDWPFDGQRMIFGGFASLVE
jgi:uncharacterized protein YbaA (DUF1428 family)